MNYKQMTSKDIWDLYNVGKLDLDKLGKEDLDTVFDIEMEELERSSAHDMSLMERCADILMHKYSDNIAVREFTIDDIAAIENDALSREQKIIVNKRGSFPKRRLIALIAAAALLIAALSIVAAAEFDLFGEFGVKIRDLFHKGGTIVSNGDKDLGVFDNERKYASFDELSKDIGFEILQPASDADYDIVEISVSQLDGYNMIYIEMSADNDARITCIVYYGEEAQKQFGEEQLKNEPSVQSAEWNGRNVYYITDDVQSQANLYDGDFVYIFTSAKKENIENYINSLR